MEPDTASHSSSPAPLRSCPDGSVVSLDAAGLCASLLSEWDAVHQPGCRVLKSFEAPVLTYKPGLTPCATLASFKGIQDRS